MGRVVIESKVGTDARIDLLAKALGIRGKRARKTAVGCMWAVWSQCVDRETDVLAVEVIAVALECEPEQVVPALCHAGDLGEDLGHGLVRVAGCEGRTDYVAKLRASAEDGGHARAASAERDNTGKFRQRDYAGDITRALGGKPMSRGELFAVVGGNKNRLYHAVKSLIITGAVFEKDGILGISDNQDTRYPRTEIPPAIPSALTPALTPTPVISDTAAAVSPRADTAEIPDTEIPVSADTATKIPSPDTERSNLVEYALSCWNALGKETYGREWRRRDDPGIRRQILDCIREQALTRADVDTMLDRLRRDALADPSARKWVANTWKVNVIERALGPPREKSLRERLGYEEVPRDYDYSQDASTPESF